MALKAEAKVLIADLTLTLEAEHLLQASSGNAVFTKCDVSNWSDLSAIPSHVTAAFGADAVADVWIAGAGVFEPRWSSFLHDTETDHYKALQINTEHPIKLTRIAMRSSLAANKPYVVLIVASMAGVIGQYGCPLYCASKHALVGFTKSMAQADEDENCKIVAILPGAVSTPLWTRDAAKDVAKQFSYADDACITADEVAEAMMEMVQSGEYPGGCLLEVSKGKPVGKLESKEVGKEAGATASQEVQQWLHSSYGPVREVWNKERGATANVRL